MNSYSFENRTHWMIELLWNDRHFIATFKNSLINFISFCPWLGVLYSINGLIEIRKWRRGKPSKLPQANHISRNEGFKTQPCQPTQMKLHLQVLHNQLQQKERPPSQHEISFLAAVYHLFHRSIHSAIEQASVFSGGSGVDASKTLREFNPTTCYDPQRPLVALVGEATNDIFDTLPDSAPITIQQSRPGG